MQTRYKIIVLLLLSAAAFNLYSRVSDNDFTESAIQIFDLRVVGTNTPINLENTFIEVRDTQKIIIGTLINNSDVPVTLVNMEFSCSYVSEEPLYQNYIVANEKNESENRYYPVEIGIGERYRFETLLLGVEGLGDCTLEVKNWSKYAS